MLEVTEAAKKREQKDKRKPPKKKPRSKEEPSSGESTQTWGPSGRKRRRKDSGSWSRD